MAYTDYKPSLLKNKFRVARKDWARILKIERPQLQEDMYLAVAGKNPILLAKPYK